MRRLRFVFAIAAVYALAGCSAYYEYRHSELREWPPIDNKGELEMEVGNSVRIHTNRNSIVAGRIISMSEAKCVVEGDTLLFSEVEAVYLRKFALVPSIAAVGGLAALGAILFTSPGTFERP